jgi:hypothetical protein
VSLLAGDTEAATVERLRWARYIKRHGLQLFAQSAYDERLTRRRVAPLTAECQRRRRAFLAQLWGERVVRQWTLLVDGYEPIGLEGPEGAPLLLAGEKWNLFAAELARLPD